jgi:hypothetical protein
MGLFDKFFSGQWDENSNCGFNEECKKTKFVISTVCAPIRATHGENAYRSCVTAAQTEPRPTSADDVFCFNPVAAWENFGYQCPGYIPPPNPDPVGTVAIGGQKVNILQIIGLLLLLVIIWIIYKRYIAG